MLLAGGEGASGVEAAHTWASLGSDLGAGLGCRFTGVRGAATEPPSLLPQVIYMARNPKDLVVSYYQFHRSLRTMSYRGTFQEFCRRFMNDKRKCLSLRGWWAGPARSPKPCVCSHFAHVAPGFPQVPLVPQ